MYVNYINHRKQAGFSCKRDSECFDFLFKSVKTVKAYLRLPTISLFVKEESEEIIIAAGIIAAIRTSGYLACNKSLAENHWQVCSTLNNKPNIERVFSISPGGDDPVNEKELPLLNGELQFNKKLKAANPAYQVNRALRRTDPWYKKMLRKIDLMTIATVIQKSQVPFDTSVKLSVDTGNPLIQNQFMGLLTDYQNFKRGASAIKPRLNKPRTNIESPVQYRSSKRSELF